MMENAENYINAFRLSKKKVQNIMEKVGDERLKNPPGDYFVLEFEDRKIDIPKQEQIGISTIDEDDKKVTTIDTHEHIRSLIEEHDQARD